ncbi:RNA pseudouridine synthase [Bdellovibrio sp. SKB1291214]|uniref:RluA family pseudouridine synthase n=1 Tax=Bdellovibrio sp. SKB1291214 TaxID=1732569 RepID=UPI000B516BCE|nr:RNA pseudouridine synthase [Bdellovibrio sp. SKB1291214]UYL09269.1 RNA pseudouridine synthase [Bdellovibrio sp. SKB1291214]
MIQIVFENTHFVICDKPAGVLSTPSRMGAEDERNCLGIALQKQLGIQIYPVHRLDFEVSGLVIYAKSADAHRKSNSWFEHKTVSKTYRALTTPQDFSHIPENVKNSRQKFPFSEGQKFEWKSRILRGKRRAFESPEGKDSLTTAQYLGANMDGYLQWDLQPVTGRSHQLRFDLSRHGFPIVGDTLYGSKIQWQAKDAIALRAYLIDFTKAPGATALGLPQKIQIDSL